MPPMPEDFTFAAGTSCKLLRHLPATPGNFGASGGEKATTTTTTTADSWGMLELL